MTIACALPRGTAAEARAVDALIAAMAMTSRRGIAGLTTAPAKMIKPDQGPVKP